jgi:DNA (cytosine-5)-methyltransferase 1
MLKTKIRHGSLFSGIGGFDLAASWLNWVNVFQVEIDQFCLKVLEKHFPTTKRYSDIKEFNGKEYYGKIDVISGGFPCQPFSQAGQRKGKEDERALFPEMLRIIQEIKPSWVVAENVYGIVNIDNGRYFDEILSSLENIRYEVQPFIIPASAVVAPHQRYRVWIVANSGSVGNRGGSEDRRQILECQSTETEIERPNSESGIIANTEHIEGDGNDRHHTTKYGFISNNSAWNESWYEVATRLCRMDDGIPSRVDRLKSLGNAIVPQIAYQIFKTICLKQKEKDIIKLIIILLILNTLSALSFNRERFNKGVKQYGSYVRQAADKYRLDTLLVYAIIEKESGWNRNAKGSFNCNGLMQVQGGSFDPAKNINSGCSILRKCLDAYKNDIVMSLTAYNAGIAGAKRMLKRKKTLVYAREVLKIYKQILES